MAINLGAFLGAAAKSGLDTYERLGEEEFRALQREKFKKDLEQEKALDALYAEKLGKVGKDVSTFTPDMTTPEAGYYPAGTEPKEALPTGRAGANYVSDSDGMALKETVKPYTQKDAYADIAREAPVVGGRKAGMEALQYKSAGRTADIEEKFDASMEKLNNTLATIQGTAESGGLKGLADAAKKEGLKVEYVEAKNGVGKINVLGPKGDVIETVASVADATSKLEQLAMKNFMTSNLGLLGSYDKLAAYMQGERKIGVEERKLKIEEEYKGKGGVIDRAYQSGSRGGSGGAAEKLMKQADELSKDNNSKYFGKKEQAFEFLKRGFVKNDDLETWNDIEKELRKQRTPADEIKAERESFFGPSRGYAPPEHIRALREGRGPKGEVLGEKDLAEFNKRYPKTPWQDIIDELPKAPQKGGLPVPR
jgi:hypothetical protein